jgi:hypothetical protein
MLLLCDPITSATALLNNPLASSLHERHCAALERVHELSESGFLYTQGREVADLLVAAAHASARRPELRALLGKLIGCVLCRQLGRTQSQFTLLRCTEASGAPAVAQRTGARVVRQEALRTRPCLGRICAPHTTPASRCSSKADAPRPALAQAGSARCPSASAWRPMARGAPARRRACLPRWERWQQAAAFLGRTGRRALQPSRQGQALHLKVRSLCGQCSL